MIPQWIQLFQQRKLWNDNYGIFMIQQRLLEDRFKIKSIFNSLFSISALAYLEDFVLVGDNCGCISIISKTGQHHTISISFVSICSILPVSSHSAIVIAGDNTIKEITIFQKEKEFNIQTKQIPIVYYKVGVLSQNSRYCFDSSSKRLYYISNRDNLSNIHISSLSVNQSSLEVSSIQYTKQFGLMSVGKDHHSITIGNETIAIQDYEVGNVMITTDSLYLITYHNSDGFIYIYNCLSPQIKYVIQSFSINSSIPPLYWKQANCFLFAGKSRGELLIVKCEDLSPSSSHKLVFCKESSRLRLDCSIITVLYLLSNFSILIGDDSGFVYRLDV